MKEQNPIKQAATLSNFGRALQYQKAVTKLVFLASERKGRFFELAYRMS